MQDLRAWLAAEQPKHRPSGSASAPQAKRGRGIHRATSGVYVAYAVWPSRERWAADLPMSDALAEAIAAMRHRSETMTQEARSHTPIRSRRPLLVRIRTATCWRSARFSRASSCSVRNSDLAAPRTAQSRLNTVPTVPAEHAAAQGVSSGLDSRQAHRPEISKQPKEAPPPRRTLATLRTSSGPGRGARARRPRSAARTAGRAR
jgi:hypothetical protein